MPEVLPVHPLELGDGLALVGESPHLHVPAVGLLDVAVELSERGLLSQVELLAAPRDEDGSQHRQRQADESHDRHQRRDGKHHHHHAHERDDTADELGQAVLERGRDEVHVVYHAAQDVALAAAVKIRQRDAVELLVDLAAQAVDDVLGDARHDEGLEVGEQALREVERHDDGEYGTQRVKVHAGALHTGRDGLGALEDRGGGASQLGGGKHVEERGCDAQKQHKGNARQLGRQ